MANIYRDILNHLAENCAVSLETVLPGEKGALADVKRRLVPVTPVTILSVDVK